MLDKLISLYEVFRNNRLEFIRDDSKLKTWFTEAAGELNVIRESIALSINVEKERFERTYKKYVAG